MATLYIAQGDSVTISGTAPGSLSGVTIAAEMTQGARRVAFTPTITSVGAGTFTLGLTAAATADLSGVWRADIQFTENGTVESSDVFLVSVLEDVTNA